MPNFDECYSTTADFSGLPADFEEYWKARIAELKKVPIELEAKTKLSRKILSEQNIQLGFQGIEKYHLDAHLLAPRKGNPPAIILFSDYMENPEAHKSFIQAGFAEIVMHLRGNDETLPKAQATTEEGEETEALHGYFAENLTEKNMYYMGQLFLDAYRLVEVVRLRKEVDTGKIGVWGIGTGAAMAMFVSYFMGRTTALFIDSPTFLNLPRSLEESKTNYAKEILPAMRRAKKKKSEILSSLSYFDGLNFLRNLTMPVGVNVDLQDKQFPASEVFAAFHALSTEKEMYLYTEEREDKTLSKKDSVSNALRFFSRHLLGKKDEE